MKWVLNQTITGNSNFPQILNREAPVPVQKMQAATACQMVFGVTGFMLYYTLTYGDKYPYRREHAFRDYCKFVGRIQNVDKSVAEYVG